ncbi:MAG TPA: glycerophosphodiester phosphodiesterase [Thermoleophilaceae bacterium]|nr:glycerophosphodiester phosphodiesterase [Thermoleophilaceae bacterium]
MPALKRVGHKGADHVAPGNTRASFEAALEHGVDMIEFDVLRLRDGRLVLAHDYEDAAKRTPLTLDEGLDLFAGEAYAEVELDVDLKLPGYEREVVEGLAGRGLSERSLLSSQYLESLDRLHKLAPELRRGWSVPRARRDYTRSAWAIPAYGLLQVIKRRLPGRAAALLRAGRIHAVMAHYYVVTHRLAEEVRAAGGELYVWTVDDARKIARFEAMGATGVITNDPRLFDASRGT